MDAILKNISKGRKRAIRSKSDLEPLMDFKQTIMKLEMLQKLLSKLLSFLRQSYKNTQLSFFVTVLFNYFYETNINR